MCERLYFYKEVHLIVYWSLYIIGWLFSHIFVYTCGYTTVGCIPISVVAVHLTLKSYKIGQSSHRMYSNNILNFQESTTILSACTKKVWKLIEFTTYKSTQRRKDRRTIQHTLLIFLFFSLLPNISVPLCKLGRGKNDWIDGIPKRMGETREYMFGTHLQKQTDKKYKKKNE